jgi:hypothetical protein
MIRICLIVAALQVSYRAQVFPCLAVKKAVAQYGEAAVESWARARGVSDQEIEKARRCLR